MSENYLYMEDLPAQAPPAASRLEKALKRAALVLAIALVCELVWVFILLPCLPFTGIEIRYTGDLSRNELLAQAGLSGKVAFIAVQEGAIEKALEALPQVASAKVEKHFPDKVLISIQERVPVATSFATVNGTTIPLSFDREGVVFRVGPIEKSGDLSELSRLPVISGLVFEQPSCGMRLPTFLAPFLTDLEKLRREQPALLAAISEIRVQKGSAGGYDLVVYPINRQVRVKIGAQLNEEVLRYMMLMLDVLDSRGVSTDELDFRTGTASYRIKEASSG